jgi:outer membrane protein TolC
MTREKTNSNSLRCLSATTWLSFIILLVQCILITQSAVLAQAPLKGPLQKSGSKNSAKTKPPTDQEELSINEPFGQEIAQDSITITKPALSALISITRTSDPFGLDSQGARTVNLPEVARLTIENNLDIGISRLDEQSRKMLYLASLGKFLPDINLGYQYNYLKGHANLPFIGFGPQGLHFDNPIIVTGAGFTYHAFRGGSILFGAMASKSSYRAAQNARHATTNDALLQAAKYFYDLQLQEAILAVRISAVRTSEAQLKLNRDLHEGGLATMLDVYQAETQLSQDRQNLIDQQIARRDAAIKLAQYLNIEQGEDLSPASPQLLKTRLVAEQMGPPDLLRIAIDNRPELKQYEALRLAAKRQIVIALAKLMPTFDFSGAVYGIGETLGHSTETRTFDTLVPSPASPGGFAVTPVTADINRRIGAVWQIGYNIKWYFQGMGTVDAANTYGAKLLARQAQLQQQKELNQVIADVRQSYLNTLSTENKIIETTAQERSSAEELRLARLRLQHGLGRNIDVLRAQQDYISALIAKAQALRDFNIAQVQLLRDTGVLSSSTLTARVPFKG